VFCDKKAVIWDLDNTLYRITPEFADRLDLAMAEALVEDLGVKMSVPDCKALVKESYRVYRDGGEVFYRDYGISPKDLFEHYFNRKPVHLIEPYEGLAEKLKKIPFEQYVFTASNRYASEKILKQIGLYEMFKDRFYSVEDFGVYKKNESADVYRMYCEKIGYDPHDCIFVDDSYSNLEFAKETGMLTVRIYYKDNSAKDKTYIDAAYKGIFNCVKALSMCKKKSAA
jgi:HAD superfamily hydrolase (TIGR01509 family)